MIRGKEAQTDWTTAFRPAILQICRQRVWTMQKGVAVTDRTDLQLELQPVRRQLLQRGAQHLQGGHRCLRLAQGLSLLALQEEEVLAQADSGVHLGQAQVLVGRLSCLQPSGAHIACMWASWPSHIPQEIHLSLGAVASRHQRLAM